MFVDIVFKMKILNLYAGIGGNRKLWGDEHEVTAVELNEDIASVYKDHYPNDKVIVGDAHEFLRANYREYDFIWASPPCPTHSRLVHSNKNKFYREGIMQYPNMMLYQEIILLQSFAECKWVVENVVPYYDPLIPAIEIQRHLFWSNFEINPFHEPDKRKHDEIEGNSIVYGYDLSKYKIKDKRKVLRNMVNPSLALHILNCAEGKKTIHVDQQNLF